MSEKEIKLKEEQALIWLPDTALRVELIVDIYIDGTIRKISQELDFEKIKKAFRDAEDYMDEDGGWVLTEKGIEYLNSLEEDDE